MAASRPSFPSEPASRRLGTGGGSARGERLVRAQLVIALVLGFTVLAVMLYLLRRPSGNEHAAAAPDPSASAAPVVPAIVRTRVEEPKAKPPAVKLGQISHVKCGASAKLSANESSLCDSLPPFEAALVKAVQDTVDCAPKGPTEGTINYAVIVDFKNKDFRVYPGRSGSWRGKQAKKATECVKRAMGAPTFDFPHQYRHYVFAVLATYPPQSEASGLPNFQ
jgi:hypothetical protein